MTNKHPADDDLSQLWQTQAELPSDITEITTKAKSQRFKQRLYIAMDVLSLSPYVILYKYTLDLDFWLQIFMFLTFVSGVFMVTYLVKLRWVSAFSSVENTQHYVTTIKKQYRNNATIAKFNKHSAWIAGTAGIIVLALINIFNDKPFSESWEKTLWVAVFFVAFLVPWYIWADKREKRFMKEYHHLNDLYPDEIKQAA